MIIGTKTISYDNRVRAFWFLMSVCVVSLAVYVYAVNAVVRNTVARQNLEAEASHLSAVIAEMEFSYIALKNDIDLEVAYARGYKDVSSPTYISRARTGALSMNTTSR